MKEANLAKSIDRAAEQRAKEVLRKLRDAISAAVQPYWAPQATGQSNMGEDIRNLMRAMADAHGWRERCN